MFAHDEMLPGSEGGWALAMALLAVVIVSMMALVLFANLNADVKISVFSVDESRALNSAEAGVAEVIARIGSGDITLSMANPRAVGQIYLTPAGSVPVLGTDSVALATAQPAGNWLTYTTANRSGDLLTVKFKTDGSGNSIYKYDVNRSLPIQADTGMPIFQVKSTGNVGGTKRTVVAEVVTRTIPLAMKGALASKVGSKVTGNAMACGYNHRVDTPYATGTNGRAGFGGCNENPANHWWEVGTDNTTGVWSSGNINNGGAANAEGTPPNLENAGAFYAGPWEVLGMTQAQFWTWIGPPLAAPPGNLNQNMYLDNNGTTQDQSASFTMQTAGSGLLYIDGDLTMNAGFTWRGLIYVEGDVKCNGQSWILGGLVVRGKTETKFNGGATILFSRDAILQNVGKGGSMNVIAWREVR